MALAVKKTEYYTYQDYLSWPEDKRWELINGKPYNMTPAPSRQHQDILHKLVVKFSNFLDNKPVKKYIPILNISLLLYKVPPINIS